VIYILVSFVNLLISAFLFKKAAGTLSLTRINLISWTFYVHLLLQSFISSVLVVNNVQYTMIALPVGMLIGSYMAGCKNVKKIFLRYLYTPITPMLSYYDTYVRYPLYMLTLLSILSVVYVFISLKQIPLLKAFTLHDPIQLLILREYAHRNFPGNEYIKNIFALTLTPILSYIAYAYYKLTKTKRDILWFSVLAIFSILVLTYDLEKSPVVLYLIGFLFLNVLINGKVRARTLLSFFTISFVLLIIVYALISKSIPLSSYNSGIIGRIILSQSAGVYLSLDTFPSKIDYLHFSSMSRIISSILGIEHHERFARLLMEQYNPKAVEMGAAGVINSLFIAEAWANFGLFGILFAPIYVGMLLEIIFLSFLKLPKTPTLLGLLAYFSYKLDITGGFNDFIYNAGYAMIFVIFVWVFGFGLMLKQTKMRRDYG